jgi:hypothetical protein
MHMECFSVRQEKEESVTSWRSCIYEMQAELREAARECVSSMADQSLRKGLLHSSVTQRVDSNHCSQ